MIQFIKQLYDRHINRSVTIENINSNRSIAKINDSIKGYKGKKGNLCLAAGLSHTTVSHYLSGKTVLKRRSTKDAMCKLYSLTKRK